MPGGLERLDGIDGERQRIRRGLLDAPQPLARRDELARDHGPAGGQSGFPAGGLPYDKFQVGKSTANYGVDVVEHVITHELGHTIGFRHSDYYNRSISCGGAASNEGSAGIGAILIPGTPANAVDNGSVMNSCFNLGSTGEWTNSDVTALNALY